MKRILWLTRHPPTTAMYEALKDYKITWIADRCHSVGEMFCLINREQEKKNKLNAVLCVFPHFARDRLAKLTLETYPGIIFGYAQTRAENWDGTFRQAYIQEDKIKWKQWKPDYEQRRRPGRTTVQNPKEAGNWAS